MVPLERRGGDCSAYGANEGKLTAPPLRPFWPKIRFFWTPPPPPKNGLSRKTQIVFLDPPPTPPPQRKTFQIGLAIYFFLPVNTCIQAPD
jgi:hypothetical protein